MIESWQFPRQRCSSETKQNRFGYNGFMGVKDLGNRYILWDRGGNNMILDRIIS